MKKRDFLKLSAAALSATMTWWLSSQAQAMQRMVDLTETTTGDALVETGTGESLWEE